VLTALLNSLLYFPARGLGTAPSVEHADVSIDTEDGARLHGWWVPAAGEPRAHVLFLHGNAGNIGDRVPHVELLAGAGLDVLAFDYRGYGNSSGRPSERGTYLDARAALAELRRRPGVDPDRVVYVGESLGGAVALELALHAQPAALVLQSTFTSIRDMARLHYPVVPRAAVPDAYPSLRLVAGLRAPLLCLHGDRDEIVPLAYGEALFEAAPEPKRLHVLAGVAHNDVLARAAGEWLEAIVGWVSRSG
jgi:fermentation-respiration switch protein FrsA (DUF1100 family)